MKKYKVEITVTRTYCVDVLENDEDKARQLARDEFTKAEYGNTEHYLETEDPCYQVSMVYDVTNTDDPFTPVNQ